MARKWVIGTLALTALGAGAGVWGWQKGQKPTVSIGRTVTAATGDIEVKVSESGTLEPVTKVDVKSRVAGRLQRIYVKAGQSIRQGDPIAIVDPTEARREVAGVQAQLMASRASLAQAEENRRLTEAQNALAIRRAMVGLNNARTAREEAALNLRNAESSLKEAQIAQKQARRQLAQTAAPTRVQEIEQAQLSVNRAQASFDDADRTARRRQSLVDQGFLAQQDADAARTQASLAKADLDSARQRLALLKEGPRKEDVATATVAVEAAGVRVEQAINTVKTARMRLRQAENSVETARVELETQRTAAAQARLRQRDVERARADAAQIENRLAQQSVQLTETRIVAPISGEVTGKYLEEGELVASATAGFAQGAAIVTISDLSRMQVKVAINEVDIARLSVGLPVKVRVDGVGGKTFPGRVVSIAPASVSQQPGSSGSGGQSAGVVRFEVKIAVETPERRLRPGMTATVDIIVEKKERVLTLPAEALRAGNKVMVVTGEGEKAVTSEKTVTVGLKNDAMVEIVEGLKAGDRVEVAPVDAKDRRKLEFSRNGGD